MATLSNLFNDESHTVLIYAFENYKFKVKDSYGKKYEIPIDRPDSIQVCENYFNSHAVGMAVARPYGSEIDFVRNPISGSAA